MSTLEINVANVCACLPAFRVLLVQIFSTLAGFTYRRYSSSSLERSILKRRANWNTTRGSLKKHCPISSQEITTERTMQHQPYHEYLAFRGITVQKTFVTKSNYKKTCDPPVKSFTKDTLGISQSHVALSDLLLPKAFELRFHVETAEYLEMQPRYENVLRTKYMREMSETFIWCRDLGLTCTGLLIDLLP